jgi:hypothetical protein
MGVPSRVDPSKAAIFQKDPFLGSFLSHFNQFAGSPQPGKSFALT